MPPAYLRGPIVDTPPLPYVPGCTGKEAFVGPEAADRVMARMGRSGDAYRCTSCFRWHVTHQRREFRPLVTDLVR